VTVTIVIEATQRMPWSWLWQSKSIDRIPPPALHLTLVAIVLLTGLALSFLGHWKSAPSCFAELVRTQPQRWESKPSEKSPSDDFYFLVQGVLEAVVDPTEPCKVKLGRAAENRLRLLGDPEPMRAPETTNVKNWTRISPSKWRRVPLVSLPHVTCTHFVA